MHVSSSNVPNAHVMQCISLLMNYVLRDAVYACWNDAHFAYQQIFFMPCNHVLIYLFVSKHKEG
jgi:hypothetical protein